MNAIRSWYRGLGRSQRIGMFSGLAVAVVLLAVVGVALSTSHSDATVATTTTTAPTTTTTHPKHHVVHVVVCPLTGVRPAGGKVPPRPALAVKIGNDPASRPQSGLDQADIVYEEMAEGGITRYMAVFQCTDAPLIGPIRSVRWTDWHILQQFGHPILAFSGGIDPWTNLVATLPWLFDANGSIYPTANAYYRYNSSTPPADQGAPYNYYSSTQALYALDKGNTTPPPQIFQYTARPPKGSTPASAAAIPFSGTSDVNWQWSPTKGVWLRSYGTSPDLDPNGQQFQAKNVVLQIVTTQPGPYDESGPDSPDVESNTTGTGTVYVLRNGVVEKGTWSRATLSDVTTMKFANGNRITLTPGNTWFEVVPSGTAITITP